MSAVRDVPLTEYVRWLINRWEADGKNLFDLEKAGGMYDPVGEKSASELDSDSESD